MRSLNSPLRERLKSSAHRFFTPNFLMVEIFRHKDRILHKSKIEEEETYEILIKILEEIHFINESLISVENFFAAYEICKDFDPKDTPFVALAFELDALIWSKDQELKLELKKNGFDSFF